MTINTTIEKLTNDFEQLQLNCSEGQLIELFVIKKEQFRFRRVNIHLIDLDFFKAQHLTDNAVKKLTADVKTSAQKLLQVREENNKLLLPHQPKHLEIIQGAMMKTYLTLRTDRNSKIELMTLFRIFEKEVQKVEDVKLRREKNQEIRNFIGLLQTKYDFTPPKQYYLPPDVVVLILSFVKEPEDIAKGVQAISPDYDKWKLVETDPEALSITLFQSLMVEGKDVSKRKDLLNRLEYYLTQAVLKSVPQGTLLSESQKTDIISLVSKVKNIVAVACDYLFEPEGKSLLDGLSSFYSELEAIEQQLSCNPVLEGIIARFIEVIFASGA